MDGAARRCGRRARDGRDFATSDEVRDRLAAAGVEVRDTPDGATWELRLRKRGAPGRAPRREGTAGFARRGGCSRHVHLANERLPQGNAPAASVAGLTRAAVDARRARRRAARPPRPP